MKDRSLVCDCWIRLMWIPVCLQRTDSTRGDPHQPLTFFGLNTHAWTVSRDIKMEKWMGRRVGSALLGEAEQDWGVLLEVTGACAWEKRTWKKVCSRGGVGGSPVKKPWDSLPHTKHRTALKSAALSLSLSLKPCTVACGLRQWNLRLLCRNVLRK